MKSGDERRAWCVGRDWKRTEDVVVGKSLVEEKEKKQKSGDSGFNLAYRIIAKMG